MGNEIKEFEDIFKDYVIRKKDYKKNKRPITVWVDAEFKDKFDNLQSLSDKSFGKKVSAFISALINKYHKD